MNVAIIVATFGDRKWQKLARVRAIPSSVGQGAAEIIPLHLEEATLAEARNRAVEKTEADWLCFIDADDEIASGYLAEMDAALDLWENGRAMARYRGTPTLFVPAVQYVRRSDQPKSGVAWIENTSPPKILDRGRPLFEINWAPIGTLIPRRLFLEVGGFRDLAALEDWELWLRCERAGAKLVAVPNAIYRAHIRPRSRNSDQRLYRQIRAEYERAA